jgi:hypothetical protein
VGIGRRFGVSDADIRALMDESESSIWRSPSPSTTPSCALASPQIDVEDDYRRYLDAFPLPAGAQLEP